MVARILGVRRLTKFNRSVAYPFLIHTLVLRIVNYSVLLSSRAKFRLFYSTFRPILLLKFVSLVLVAVVRANGCSGVIRFD
jgi:hypothetical protein